MKPLQIDLAFFCNPVKYQNIDHPFTDFSLLLYFLHQRDNGNDLIKFSK